MTGRGGQEEGNRVGLIEQPSIGKRTMCARKTAKPIAAGAAVPADDALLTAVS